MNTLRRGLWAASLVGLTAALPANAQQVPEFWHYLGAGGELDGVTAMMETVEPQTKGEITHRVVPGGAAGLRQQVQVSMMGGVPPTAYQVSAGLELIKLAESGRLVAIDDVWDTIRGDEIYPAGLVQAVTLDGSHYGVPFSMGILGNVWYNKKVFDELGLTPPTTWEEWDAVATKLQDAGKVALTSASGPAWTTYQFYGAFLQAFGVDGYRDFIAGKVPLTDPRMADAADLFQQHFIAFYDKDWTGAKWSDGLDRLIKGDVAMYPMGDWASGYLKTRGMVPDQDYGFFAMPGMDNATIFQSDAVVILKGDETELGKTFATAVADPAAQEAFNAGKGSVAPNLEVDPSFYDAITRAEFDKLMQDEMAVLPNLYVMMPSGFRENLGSAIEKFAATGDRESFDAEMERLEEERAEHAEAGDFAEF